MKIARGSCTVAQLHSATLRLLCTHYALLLVVNCRLDTAATCNVQRAALQEHLHFALLTKGR